MNSDELLRYSAIFNLLTVSIHVSTVTTEILGTRPLPWSHAESLIQPALSCLNSIINEIEYMKDIKEFSVRQSVLLLKGYSDLLLIIVISNVAYILFVALLFYCLL